MYAIVEINGQQFKVEEGKKLFVNHLQSAEAGQTVEFDKVLVFHKKRRKGYRKLNGYRHQFTEVSVKEVIA